MDADGYLSGCLAQSLGVVVMAIAAAIMLTVLL
jgi:hypothetical protein